MNDRTSCVQVKDPRRVRAFPSLEKTVMNRSPTAAVVTMLSSGEYWIVWIGVV